MTFGVTSGLALAVHMGDITFQPCGDLGYPLDQNCFNTSTAPHFMDALYY